MAGLSEQDALLLVAIRGHCDELQQWRHRTDMPRARMLHSGVQDAAGARKDQFVRLACTQSAKDGTTIHYCFTLFLDTPAGPERIYQLDIFSGKNKAKSWHQRPHEHMGSSRRDAPAPSALWHYEDALAYFCKRANIYLAPLPENPFSGGQNDARRHH